MSCVDSRWATKDRDRTWISSKSFWRVISILNQLFFGLQIVQNWEVRLFGAKLKYAYCSFQWNSNRHQNTMCALINEFLVTSWASKAWAELKCSVQHKETPNGNAMYYCEFRQFCRRKCSPRWINGPNKCASFPNWTLKPIKTQLNWYILKNEQQAS